jgi:hypothetical protein
MSDVTSVKVFHVCNFLTDSVSYLIENVMLYIFRATGLLTCQTLFDLCDAVHGSIAHIRNVLLSVSQCLKQISKLTQFTEQNPVIFIYDFPA